MIDVLRSILHIVKAERVLMIMWITTFGIICLALALLNIGYSLFDHE